jgi:hypothetical protein
MKNPLDEVDPEISLLFGFFLSISVGLLVVGLVSSIQGCHRADVAMEQGYEQVVDNGYILWKKADNAN